MEEDKYIKINSNLSGKYVRVFLVHLKKIETFYK